MTITFEKLYKDLRRTTGLALFAAFGFLGLALLSALAGLPHAVISFRQAAGAMGYAFGVLLAFFLLASLVVAFMRFRGRPAQQRPASPR